MEELWYQDQSWNGQRHFLRTEDPLPPPPLPPPPSLEACPPSFVIYGQPNNLFLDHVK